MIKYRTGETHWSVRAKIEEVEIEKETDSSVWVKGHRNSKFCQSGVYHDTWDKAHAYLMSIAETQANQARRRLEEANGALGNVKGMKKPVA